MARFIYTVTKTKGKTTTVKEKTRAPAKTNTLSKTSAVSKTKAKTKRPATESGYLQLNLNVGHWLDVMDSEGTWNVAEIIALPSETEVEVKYDGWGDEFNELVPLNTGRVAPYHTYTWAVKCWAKYKDWPWWPAIVTFRPPGTTAGQGYLAGQTRMFVDFLDNVKLANRCRTWVEQKKIKPFNDTTTQLYRKATSPGFEASFERVLLSDARGEFAPLVKGGTLPVEFKAAVTLPCKKMKAALGHEQWITTMNSSQVRHARTYVYQPASIEEDLGFDSDDMVEDPHGDLGDMDYRIDKEPTKKRTQSDRVVPRKKLKTERSAPIKRLILTGENLRVSRRASDEGRILDGPHAPSPNSDEEKISSADEPELLEIVDVQVASDPVQTSEEEEKRGPSRVLKRLRVRRTNETSPTRDLAVTKKRPRREDHESVVKPTTATSTRPRLRRAYRDVEDGDEEAPAVEVVASNGADSSESDSAETPLTTETVIRGQDREEPEEIILSSDEDTSQQDFTDDLGAVDAVDVENDDADPDVDEDIEIVAIANDDEHAEEVAVEKEEEEEDEEDEIPADPLDDWGATRSSGVEEFIQVGAPVATPLPSLDVTREQLAMETRLVISVQGEDREGVAVPDQEAEAQVSPVDAIAATSATAPNEIETETAPRVTEESSHFADADTTELPTPVESTNVALKKRPAKSRGAKTTKTATKELPHQRSHQAFSDTTQPSSLPVSQSGLTKGTRRSSMGASRVGHIQMPRGRTPVWVLPPPMHEAPSGDDSLAPSKNVHRPVVPTSPPFSSSQSFSSSMPFKIQTWIETRLISADLDLDT